MKINIQLSDGFRTSKSKSSRLYIKGSAFINDKLLSDIEILKGLETQGLDFISNLNGFYAFVFINPELNIAVVDIIRSIPIFYSINETNNQINISDSTRTLNNHNTINIINKEVFQLCSYVIGNETLYTDIYQILAGNYLNITNLEANITNYFQYEALEPSDHFDEDNFVEQVHQSINSSFKRLIEYADGRQIVIPLSGGYDSRLIVSVLKYLNYENIVCFSYGKLGNAEAEYSKNIADSLGLKWIFIEYTPDKWKRAWNSTLSQNFIKFASHDSALPHIQDWLAIKEIKDKKLVEENAVFVPGHCCVTGYITHKELNKKSRNLSLEAIYDRHFSIAPISETEVISNLRNLKAVIADKVSNQINLNDDLPNCVTKYNWQERQSKYIANSVRTYEFFGFDWWLPLWDKEFTVVWKTLPNTKRVNRRLYKVIVSNIYSEVSSIKADLGNASNPTFKYLLAQKILNLVPSQVTGTFKSIYRRKEYSNHPLELSAIINDKDLRQLTSKGYKINGIYTYYYLRDLWK